MGVYLGVGVYFGKYGIQILTFRLKFAFQMYDLDEDNKVSVDEILTVLQMMVGVNIPDDQASPIRVLTTFPVFYLSKCESINVYFD